jgi:hypothetical protein
MRTALAAVLVLSAACGAAAAEQETYDEEMARLARGMPADVADYIPRYVGCIHWGGEFGDDTPPERMAQINKAMEELRCDTIEAEGKALDARYGDNRAVMERLKQVRGDFGGE